MRRLALIVVLLGGWLGWLAVPSSASTYYDYWGYWHKPPGATAWQYSKVGPSGYYLQPDHPQVEGWRYAIGTASQNDPKPRPVDVSYDDYCAGHDTSATYRVLLVVDYGTQSGAPKGPVYSCYGFTGDAPSGLQVLTKQHTERDSGGLICAIDSYPKTGCGDVVSSPAPKATSTITPKPPTPTHAATTSSRTATVTTAPDATKHSGSATATTTQRATTQPTDDVSMSAAPAPESASPAIVAKPFVPPRDRGGVPFGFIAACVFVVALAGAVVWQRRRRAG